MNLQNRIACLLACFMLIICTPHHTYAQQTPKSRKLEWYFNPLSLAALNINLGLRINSQSNWKPDLFVTVQLPPEPVYGIYPPQIGYAHLFQSMVGGAVSFYGGLTYMKHGWANPGMRFSILLGGKALHTGIYNWGGGGYEGQECGTWDEIRINFGPKATMGTYLRFHNRFGLELYWGAGFRAGFHQYKILYQAEINNEICYAPYGFTPDTKFRAPELSLVPTLHAGLNLVFR